MIKAIDTYYNGNYFRSRLEARWAVFFEAAGIKYQYESEGFDLGDGDRYLPDFYLPEFDHYLEVKPGIPAWKQNGAERDTKKWEAFAAEKKLIICFGNPGTETWKVIGPNWPGKVKHAAPIKAENIFTAKDEWQFIFFATLRSKTGDSYPEGLYPLSVDWGHLAEAVNIANRARFDHLTVSHESY